MIETVRAIVISALVCSVVLLALPAAADAGERKWHVGTGVAAVPDYEGSNDLEPRVIGTGRLTWESGRFIDMVGARGSGAAPRFRANILRTGRLRFGPVIQVRRARDDVSNAQVDRLPKVDTAVEVGAFASMDIAMITADLTFATAVKEYSGGTIELALGYDRDLTDTLRLHVGGSSTWASGGYMDTYFSITPDQAADSGLPVPPPGSPSEGEYDASHGVKDIGGDLSLAWRGTGWEHWSIVALGRYARLIGDAEDSPVVKVGDEDQWFGGLMVVFNN